MKCPIKCLNDWVELSLTPEKLAEEFTMAGLEVDTIESLKTDTVLDIDLTPNRADCASIIGLAQEVSALTRTPLKKKMPTPVSASIDKKWDVTVSASDLCPHYACRVIEGLDNSKPSPQWLIENLDAFGARSVDPVVDILNWTMFVLGQPMHAFDADKLNGTLRVEKLKKQSKLSALDGSEKILPENTLVITDENGPIAAAGIIGGQDSAVSSTTSAVVLESAHFLPSAITGKSIALNCHTESSWRFERGIHPDRQVDALEMATALILECCGGQAGPVSSTRAGPKPEPKVILLRHLKLEKLLGISVPAETVSDILTRLGASVVPVEGGWNVTAPLARLDWNIEVDLIEEVVRLIGYHTIEAQKPRPELTFRSVSEGMSGHRIKQCLVDRGFQEIITYSFVCPKLQATLLPHVTPVALQNPISEDKSVMRLSLWPGLLDTIANNARRQHPTQRLFEIGQRFEPGSPLVQTLMLGGALSGQANPEGWANEDRKVDFFDMKAHLLALFKLSGLDGAICFEPKAHPVLHPGQSAELLLDGKAIGWAGRLHPKHASSLDLPEALYLFECSLAALEQTRLPVAPVLSKFPSVRRDISLLVDADCASQALTACLKDKIPNCIETIVFDVYAGKGIPENKKSLAIGLILQELSRTLLEEEVEASVQNAVKTLEDEFGAKLRE